MFRKILVAALIGASFASVPLASMAREVVVTVAPPPPRQEAVPQPRRGKEWVPGYWDWRNRKHVWVAGHWVQVRRGQVYSPPHWVERNGRWVKQEGRWARTARDRDGDGVPNRMDAKPNNPNKS